MKLTAFNGSPRGESSNTKILMGHFAKGFETIPGNSFEGYDLKKIEEHSRYAEIFRQSETVLLAFPLYTDAMPGIVKAFIEKLTPKEVSSPGAPEPLHKKDACARKRIIFLVQSGFPEAVHCEAVEKYLKKLARRLGYECGGVIIKAGAEGIQAMPPQMTCKLFKQFYALGEIFGKSGKLDEGLLKKLRGKRRFSLVIFPLFYLMKWVGLMDFYWNQKLKENGAFERRFDRPYSVK